MLSDKKEIGKWYGKKNFAALFFVMMIFCAAVWTADFKAGDVAYVKKYSLPVTEKPVAGGSKFLVNPGAKVTASGSETVQIKDSVDDGKTVAEVKNGASIDVIQKDFGSGYFKIWFNSKVCYIKTENLTDFQSTPSATGLARLGSPIGTLVADSPWSEYGQKTYSAEGLAIIKNNNYGYDAGYQVEKELESIPGAVDEITDQEWVNVYDIEEFSFDADPDFPECGRILSGKIYTVVHGGKVRYIVQLDEMISSFT